MDYIDYNASSSCKLLRIAAATFIARVTIQSIRKVGLEKECFALY